MTKEEWVAWKNLELTQKVFELLKEEIENIKSNWANGNYRDDRVNFKQIGVIEGINKVLGMEVEDEE